MLKEDLLGTLIQRVDISQKVESNGLTFTHLMNESQAEGQDFQDELAMVKK